MPYWSKGLTAAMGCGVVFCLVAGPVQAAAKPADKHAKAAEKSSEAAHSAQPSKVAVPLNIKIRPAQVTAAPAEAVHGAQPAKVAMPLNIKIRPAQVTVAPAEAVHEPVLVPIAYTEDPAPTRPSRAVPLRAYARDGASFYQNGQLIRIQGLDETGSGGEHAKQRLQQLLDGGQITVSPVEGAPGGGMLAVVRVNGRDVAESLTNN